MRFLTADQHFGQNSVLQFTKRPWKSVGEHDRALIRLWNEKVGEDDDVFVVGDFSFHDRLVTRYILRDCLMGNKHLILGNHDGTVKRNVDVGAWCSVKQIDEVDGVMLVHDSLNWAMRHAWSEGLPKMFCGHVHLNWKTCWGRFVNVGVDQWGYAPVEWDEAKKCFE